MSYDQTSTKSHTLKERFTIHKKSTERCYISHYIRDNYNGDWSKCKIELYENYPCNNKKELDRKEGETTKLIGTINKRIAGRTEKEWYEDNKEKILEQMKEYYENNKEILLEKVKEYYEDNKEVIIEKHKEKIECECGSWISRGCIARHRKSQKHINLMKSREGSF